MSVSLTPVDYGPIVRQIVGEDAVAGAVERSPRTDPRHATRRMPTGGDQRRKGERRRTRDRIAR